MKISFKQNKHQVSTIWKKGYLLAALVLLLVTACTELMEDGGPLGPTAFPFRITVSEAKLNQLGTHTFSAVHGTDPVFWSISTTAIGNIVAETGVFTAGAVAGSATITAKDAKGLLATATVTVLPNLLTVTPGNITRNTAGVQAFLVAGGVGTNFVWSISKDTANSVATAVLAASTTTTVNATLTIATSATDTWTITVKDEAGNVGTATMVMDTR